MTPLILHIEDDDAHATLTSLAIREFVPDCRIVRTRDGVEAIEYLRSVEVLPDLVLLDLNLPRIDGIGVLEHVKGDDRLRIVPVVVMTTSDSILDRERALAHHANSVVTKPLDLDEFDATVELLCTYWLRTVA